MQLNPYLFYDGKCEEALKYYEKALGARIEAMMPYGDGPAEMPIPADWKTKIMHASRSRSRIPRMPSGGSLRSPRAAP